MLDEAFGCFILHQLLPVAAIKTQQFTASKHLQCDCEGLQ